MKIVFLTNSRNVFSLESFLLYGICTRELAHSPDCEFVLSLCKEQGINYTGWNSDTGVRDDSVLILYKDDISC